MNYIYHEASFWMSGYVLIFTGEVIEIYADTYYQYCLSGKGIMLKRLSLSRKDTSNVMKLLSEGQVLGCYLINKP